MQTIARHVTISVAPETPVEGRSRLLFQAMKGFLALLLIFCMSVYVSSPRPKIFLTLGLVLLFLGWRRIRGAGVVPLIALVCHGMVMGFAFPSGRPDAWTVIQYPVFLLDCILLFAICAAGCSLQTQYFVCFGILAASTVGLVGDMLGHDMTALLPFDMPNEAFFDQVTTNSSGGTRIRGFFAESGVLGAVCMGISTTVGFGALALILARVHIRRALAALFAALMIGGVCLSLTVTKSGMVMVMAGVMGFLLTLLLSHNGKCRMAAVAATLMAMTAAAVFVFAAPSEMTSYLKGEVSSVVNLYQGIPTPNDHTGLGTRLQCWKAALYSVRYYPLGVGPWGIGSVLDKPTNVQITPEMQFFFDRNIFGLKNILANLLAETGLVGLGLLVYWLWRNFVTAAFRQLGNRSTPGIFIAALYIASAFMSVAFMVSCELYPAVAFLLLLKYHADAVASAVSPLSEDLPIFQHAS